jgi:DNA-binding MarR family transcriptional regulator
LRKRVKNELDAAAGILQKQHADQRTDTFLKFLAMSDVFTRYLNLQYTSKEATRSGFNVLNTLVLSGGAMSPTEISKKIYRSKNAICHVVSTLESHGLVTTEPADVDRRSVVVRITAKGLALTEKESILARERLGRRIFSIFTDEEITCLNQMFAKLMQHTLQQIDKNRP